MLENIIFTSEEVFSFADLTNEEMVSALFHANVFVGTEEENIFLLRVEKTQMD